MDRGTRKWKSRAPGVRVRPKFHLEASPYFRKRGWGTDERSITTGKSRLTVMSRRLDLQFHRKRSRCRLAVSLRRRGRLRRVRSKRTKSCRFARRSDRSQVLRAADVSWQIVMDQQELR